MTHDYRTCRVQDCEECQELVDYGLIIACDECDMPGDAGGDFHLMPDGRTLCSACYTRITQIVKEEHGNKFDDSFNNTR